MKAELTSPGSGELLITFDAGELPLTASDRALQIKLPEHAAQLADGILGMITEPPEPGPPKTVTTVHVRVVRTIVVAETSLVLDSERQVYAA